MNKTLKLFGRFFISGLVSVFILVTLTFVSSTLPIQAYAASTPVVTSIVSPTHSSWGSKIGDFFKSIFGGKDKVVTPTPPVPLSGEENTPNPSPAGSGPSASSPTATPTTIIQQIAQAGLTGNTGPQGLRGLTGPQGPKGDKGESGVNIDTSSFVTKLFFDKQIDGIFNSMGKNIQGLSDSLSKEVNTNLLTVTGNGSFSGILTASSLNVTDKVTTRANLGLTLASNDEVVNNTIYSASITTWGDSLTFGSGGTPYPTTLESILGSMVYNEGIGGQTSTQIAIRQGGVQTTATIVGGIIPASGGVTVTFPSGYEPVNTYGPTEGVSGTISGIYGTVTYSAGIYIFTRLTSGSTVSVDSAPFIVDTGTLNNGIAVIWVGRNNYSDPDRVKADIAAMVANLGSNTKYLILSVTNNASNEQSGSANYTTITSLNSYLASTYAGHYLDIRSYLINNGLSDAGITPTSQDLTDIANDLIPTSLHYLDGLHFNTPGYTIIAQQVAKFIQDNFYGSEIKSNNVLTVSNLSSIFASPMAIGTTKPNVGIFSTLTTNSSIYLPSTSSSGDNGVVYLGGNRFIHAFKGNNGTLITTGDNTFVGLNAGNFTMGSTATNGSNASYNTAIGYQSFFSNTNGSQNTAIGVSSLYSNTIGGQNTANGVNSLYSNTTGVYNTANGFQSLYSNTIGVRNTANGVNSLYSNTTGNYNTANGVSSLSSNITGYNNVANGYASLYSNTAGYNNTANGVSSLYFNTTGIHNTANGWQSLYSNTTGNYNTANGASSLFYSGGTKTAGSFITGVSYTIITAGTTDFTAIGAADSNVGTVFTANGAGSGTGTAAANSKYNTAFGVQAGKYLANGSTALTAPSNSLFIGYNTMASADGLTNENVFGYSAIGSGSNTITLGNNAITGTYFDGKIAKILGMNRHPTANTAGNGLTLKSGGATLLATDKNGGDLTLSSGIATGTGTSNIHFFTGKASTTGTADNATTEKMTILGSGNVGIGATSPTNILHVTGTPVAGTHVARIANTLNGATQNNGLLILAGNDTGVATSELITFKRPDNTTIGTITQTAAGAIAFNSGSDRRIKDAESIKPTIYGLSDLLNIKVDDFTFISDPRKQQMTGFIAQELNAIYPGAVTTNGDNGTDTLAQGSTPWMVDYSKLTPLLVKSIQEMDLKITDISNLDKPNTWRDSLIAWFGNATNGIAKIFVGEINAKDANVNNLCITDDSGEKVCITKQELLQIKTSAGIGATNSSSGGSENTDNTKDTDVCPNIEGVQAETPAGDEINADGLCVAITGGDTGGTDSSVGSNGDSVDKSKSIADTTAPIITLSGESSITLKVGDPYKEAGAIAKDNVDATVNVDISGTVDTTTAGIYTITYNAKDAADNHAKEVTRTVTVE